MRLVSDASKILNYYVYLKNTYLHHTYGNREGRFPYVELSRAYFLEPFEEGFADLWKSAVVQLAEDLNSDSLLYETMNERVRHHLFCPSAKGGEHYRLTERGFQHWWESFAGGFALERSLSDAIHTLYDDVNQQEVGDRAVSLGIIYDDVELSTVVGPLAFVSFLLRRFF
ncbi:hypothetical protein [Geomicrobium sp. JCM 19039]|uniref:hypothetical protein n=1 Tax=Geomicrobium sp. JCM 19039 TaxID=1460636 RepID=UPI00045F21D2|nr:hypothetical protein [Geomicrobium sp. JCM 19039]GAK12148.1 hypothetical protein JCM19039_1889 [Geomicrobium sp. JCM 19039]